MTSEFEKYGNLMAELYKLLEPHMSVILDHYKEKTYLNKLIVNLIIQNITATKFNKKFICLADKTIYRDNKMNIINAIESLRNIRDCNIDISPEIKYDMHYFSISLGYFKKKCMLILEDYYSVIAETDKMIQFGEKTEIIKQIEALIDLAIDENHNNTHDEYISMIAFKIQSLKKYINLETIKNSEENKFTTNFTNLDFSYKSLGDMHINWNVSNSNFNNAKFICNNKDNIFHHHVIAINCNFDNAIFKGKLCIKGSNYDNSSFKNVDLTALLYNPMYASMKQCDFTDAFIIDNFGNKIMGKALLLLLEKNEIYTNGSYYYSPKDKWFIDNQLNNTIFISN